MSDSGQAPPLDARRLSELAAADVRRVNSLVEGGFLRQREEGTAEILLVRHAQMDSGADPPLTDLGRGQAEALGSFLATSEIQAVYSSRTRRTQETAEAIASHHGLKVRFNEELQEFKFQAPRGKTTREAFGDAEFAAKRERFRQERRFEAYGPYIEDGESLRRRITAALDEVIVCHPGGRVVVVSHGGTIAAYLAAILESPYDMPFLPRPTAVSLILAKDDRRSALVINSYSHFGAL